MPRRLVFGNLALDTINATVDSVQEYLFRPETERNPSKTKTCAQYLMVLYSMKDEAELRHKIPIEDLGRLGLRQRYVTALKNAGYKTTGDIVKSEGFLTNIPDFEDVGRRELKGVMAKCGLTLYKKNVPSIIR